MPNTILRVGLAVSVCANVLAACCLMQRPPVAAAAAPEAEAKRPSNGPAVFALSRKSPDASATVQYGGNASITKLIEELRQSGTPPHVIRRIVEAIIKDRFSSRRAELLYPSDRPFWTHGATSGLGDALASLNKQEFELVDQLLGQDARAESPEQAKARESKYGHVSTEKVAAIEKIQRDYLEIANKAGNAGTPEERARKTALLEREKLADIRKVLTPVEFAEFELHGSPTALRLRWNVKEIELLEPEYRQLFQIQKGLEERILIAPSDNDKMIAHEAAYSNARQLLGDRRLLDYLKNSSGMFAATAQVAAQFNLPVQTVFDVTKIQRETLAQLQRLKEERSLTAQERAGQINSALAAAEARVQGILGPTPTALYKQRSGQWLLPSTIRVTPSPAR